MKRNVLKRNLGWTVAGFGLVFGSVAYAQAPRYVATCGDDNNNGTTSNCNAGVNGPTYTIQKAINLASNNATITVANGIYSYLGTPPIDNVNLSWSGKNLTIKSAGGAGNCTIDCDFQPGVRAFKIENGQNSTTVIDGFTIKNGRGSPGGGIIITGSSPQFKNCVIEDCCTNIDCLTTTGSGSNGGGLHASGVITPTIENCTFRNNTARGSGGAIYLNQDVNATIKNCIIGEPGTNKGNKGTYGGGIDVLSASPIITGNTIQYNQTTASDGKGGGIRLLGNNNCSYHPKVENNTILENTAVSAGGGIYSERIVATIRGNTIRCNDATNGNGGGISAFKQPACTGVGQTCNPATDKELCTVARNMLEDNTALTTTLDLNNPPLGRGGGIYFSTDAQNDRFIVRDCTIRANTATHRGGGVYFLEHSSLNLRPVLMRSIIAENSAGGAGRPAE